MSTNNFFDFLTLSPEKQASLLSSIPIKIKTKFLANALLQDIYDYKLNPNNLERPNLIELNYYICKCNPNSYGIFYYNKNNHYISVLFNYPNLNIANDKCNLSLQYLNFDVDNVELDLLTLYRIFKYREDKCNLSFAKKAVIDTFEAKYEQFIRFNEKENLIEYILMNLRIMNYAIENKNTLNDLLGIFRSVLLRLDDIEIYHSIHSFNAYD